MITLWMLIKDWARIRSDIIVTHSESGLAAIWYKCVFIGRISDDALYLDGGRLTIKATDPALFEKLDAAINDFAKGSRWPSMRTPGSWSDQSGFPSLW